MKKNEDKGLVLYVLQRMNLSMKSDKQGEKEKKIRKKKKSEKGHENKGESDRKVKKIY